MCCPENYFAGIIAFNDSLTGLPLTVAVVTTVPCVVAMSRLLPVLESGGFGSTGIVITRSVPTMSTFICVGVEVGAYGSPPHLAFC